MRAYCQEIWRFRYFWMSLVRMDLHARYRGSVLGIGWSLLQPIAMTAIFTLVFCKLFNKDPFTYSLYVLTGLSLWQLILNSTLAGCQCYFQAEAYIRQQPVPLAVYPLRIGLGAMFHFLIGLGICLPIAGYVLGHYNLAALLSLPATFVLLVLLTWALATLGGLCTVYFRDTRYIAEVSFQALFYMTPLFYDVNDIKHPMVCKLLRYNPVLPFLDLVRQPLLEGHVPSMQNYAKACVIVVAAVLMAMYALSRLERRVIFHL